MFPRETDDFLSGLQEDAGAEAVWVGGSRAEDGAWSWSDGSPWQPEDAEPWVHIGTTRSHSFRYCKLMSKAI